MPKVLISGFEPFDGLKSNPSMEIVQGLEDSQNLRKIILPVSYKESFERLKKEIDDFSPEIVISLGVARPREKVSLERVAINWIESKISDNDGVESKPQKINEEDREAYFSTLPIYDFLKLSNDLEISNTAGTYVCNYLMYKLLQYTEGKSVQAGFIHVPMDVELGKKVISKIFESL